MICPDCNSENCLFGDNDLIECYECKSHFIYKFQEHAGNLLTTDIIKIGEKE